jgi:hypothetical protein
MDLKELQKLVKSRIDGLRYNCCGVIQQLFFLY